MDDEQMQYLIKETVKKMILDGEITLTTIKGKELEHSMLGEEYIFAHETTTLVLGVQDNELENEKEIQKQTESYGIRL